MATEVLLPKLGFAMSEGSVAQWFVPDGGSVTEGTPLFALETEKSVQEIDAPASGTLRILKPIGEVFEVGEVLAVIE
jgi:pyruvate/2-oxoglutarate dehydrogenase complex dihydrolipoamide acyltransferase (E2) component